MKLHYAPPSPFVRMVLVTAHECGLADEIELVDTGAFLPIHAHEAVSRDNPLGRIPAMVLEDGSVLFDSRVICEYLVDRAGNDTLLPASGDARWRVLTLQALAQGLADTGVQTRYEMGVRPQELQWPDLIARQKQRFQSALDALEGPWFDDLQEVTLGSISAAVVLAYLDFRFPDIGWRAGRERLAQWHKSFSERPSMVATAV